MNLKVTIFLTLNFCYATVIAQTSISKIDLSHQYSLSKTYDAMVYGYKAENTSILFASYQLPDTLASLTVSFWGADKYEDDLVRIDSLISEEYYLGESEGRHYYEYHITSPFPLIAVEMVTRDNYSLIYDAYFDTQKFNVILYDSDKKLPVLERWVRKGTSYTISNMSLGGIEMYISQFPYQFDPATPPMSIKPVENKEIAKNSSFIVFDDGELNFDKSGYYLIQNDTNSNQGYGWRLPDESFPSMNQIEDLVRPLKYITTPEEYKALTSSNSKVEFDSFWLKLGKEQGPTRSMISMFYKRVEMANRLFTSYKEGWKTDQGMVYIVYGPPQQVQRTEKGETWWYENENTNQVFQFLRFSHVFYPHNYVLERNAAYRRSWFTAVDLIRNNRF